MGKRCPNKNSSNGFLSYKIPNHKISKFPKIPRPLEIFLVGAWTRKYKGRSSQFLPTTFLRYKFLNKIPIHKKIQNFLTISRPLGYLQSEPRLANTKDAVRSFATPSVLPQYFPSAVKKFPNQMLRKYS